MFVGKKQRPDPLKNEDYQGEAADKAFKGLICNCNDFDQGHFCINLSFQ